MALFPSIGGWSSNLAQARSRSAERLLELLPSPSKYSHGIKNPLELKKHGDRNHGPFHRAYQPKRKENRYYTKS
jgi:hypothetical protein